MRAVIERDTDVRFRTRAVHGEPVSGLKLLGRLDHKHARAANPDVA